MEQAKVLLTVSFPYPRQLPTSHTCMNLHAIAAATVLLFLVAPLVLGVIGIVRSRHQPKSHSPLRIDWELTVRSALLYTLAFNLTFLLQELFLVIPKALTPGLRPTLFHNNHTWEGTHPLANLFQGTGALATMLMSLSCIWLLGRVPVRLSNLRLFLLWMAYCGMLMALPQFAIGAFSAGSDLGMAMTYFGLSEPLRLMLGLVALAVIPFVALRLTRPLIALASGEDRIAGARDRAGFVFFSATLPALSGAILSIAFRVPREWIEVVLLPAWVAIFGTVWMQAGACCIEGEHASGARSGVAVPLAAVVLLLLVFQFVLRPGIAFY
jgi:hypothetical protein